MKIKDGVLTITPTVQELHQEFAKLNLKGDWEIQRLSHLVSAFETKTGEIHMFLSNDSKVMAQELQIRDLEIFTGTLWS